LADAKKPAVVHEAYQCSRTSDRRTHECGWLCASGWRMHQVHVVPPVYLLAGSQRVHRKLQEICDWRQGWMPAEMRRPRARLQANNGPQVRDLHAREIRSSAVYAYWVTGTYPLTNVMSRFRVRA